MSEIDEKLSVVLDEYSDDEQSHEELSDVIGDVNLQYRMRRYQMIGDIMRHELPDQINLGFSQQVMAEIQNIESPSKSPIETEQKATFWQWATLKPLAGFAVAATVAVISITLWQSVSIGPQGDQTDNQVVSVEQQKIDKLAGQPLQINVVPVSSNMAMSMEEGTRWRISQESPALQQKLNAYLVNHTEYSVPIQGLIPQARVAGYDAQQ